MVRGSFWRFHMLMASVERCWLLPWNDVQISGPRGVMRCPRNFGFIGLLRKWWVEENHAPNIVYFWFANSKKLRAPLLGWLGPITAREAHFRNDTLNNSRTISEGRRKTLWWIPGWEWLLNLASLIDDDLPQEYFPCFIYFMRFEWKDRRLKWSLQEHVDSQRFAWFACYGSKIDHITGFGIPVYHVPVCRIL